MENARVDPARFHETARLLLQKGAELTPRAAVALGDREAVLRLHREGRLPNEIHMFRGGLLAIAVRVNRLDMVATLLDLGLDPDESVLTDDGDRSWGMLVLDHGIDPDAPGEGGYTMLHHLASIFPTCSTSNRPFILGNSHSTGPRRPPHGRPCSLASDRPDPQILRPGQARRHQREGRPRPSRAMPGLSESGRRDVGRQLPRPHPRCAEGRRAVVVGEARPGVTERDQRTNAVAPPPAGTLPPGLADHPDYQILRELGQGGMGVVYLAQNKLMGRLEVLKVVSGHLMNRRGVLDRFLGEIRNAARLASPQHRHRLRGPPLGEGLVLAMEYVEGLDLARTGQGPRAAAGGQCLQLRPPGGPGLAARTRARDGPPRHQARQPHARPPGEPAR